MDLVVDNVQFPDMTATKATTDTKSCITFGEHGICCKSQFENDKDACTK